MGKCKICQRVSPFISSKLGVCKECVRNSPDEALRITSEVHARARAAFGLPPEPPQTLDGIPCGICANNCKVGKGERGYCGLVVNLNDKLVRLGGMPERGVLEWYYDSLPTNCVAWWFCPGCTGRGYPKYAYKPTAEYGYLNLAVFYGACLPEFEKVFAIIDGKPIIIAIGKLVEFVLQNSSKTTTLDRFTIAKSYSQIKVASLDQDHRIKYVSLKRVSKRMFKGHILKIGLEKGRTLYVTPDHPMLILQKDGFAITAAEHLKVGDYIPVIKHLPNSLDKVDEINLINAFTKRGLEHKIMVHGAKQLLYGKKNLRIQLNVRKHLIDNWRRSDSLPLWVFNALNDGKIPLSNLKIGLKYSSKKNLIKAVLPMNRELARLLGYYLSEGSCSYGRIGFSVAWGEADIADEIQNLLRHVFNVPSKRKVMNWKGRESSLVVDVRNKTIELLFKEVFEVGEDSYNKKVPWFCYTWNEEYIGELINAYFVGDGHVRQSISNNKKRNSLIVLANTASQDLALGVNLLLSYLGVQTCLRQPKDSRSTYLINIQGGRSLQIFFEKSPSLFIRRGFHKVPKPNPQALAPVFELYPRFLLRDASLKVAHKRISLRRVNELGLRGSALLNGLIEGDVHPIRVRKIELIPYEGYVYDLEVDSSTALYATFMLASGAVIHNCSYDCLYCQNWHYRKLASEARPFMSAESLAKVVDKRVSCVCHFGGDPSPQALHALRASEVALARARDEGQILRICWETNGFWNPKLALKAAELSFESGGIVKFDLKFWDEGLNKAICGVSNKPSFENFRTIGDKFFKERPEVPILTASTLLVPGYVDEEEVSSIAKFVASVDPRIPYTLLAFYPCYVMNDLPTTSRKLAYDCYDVARKHLENVRIGNIHLLS